ncbi:MAG: DUF4234 domain-containing protein [Candidatus Woesearchaeota archaeon]
MVNKRLIQYIKTEEAQGYTPKRLRAWLIRNGYKATEVDEALRYANQKDIYPPPRQPVVRQGRKPIPQKAGKQLPQKRDAVKKPVSSAGIKNRNPILVLIFSLITLGIYAAYWLVSTTNELRRNTKSAPNPWLLLLMIIPLVNFIVALYYYYKYSKAIEELTGFSLPLLFLLWIFVSPAAMILAQIELNKKAV